MIDVAASEGWLAVTLRIMTLVQMCIQGRWASDSSLLTLPYMGEGHTDKLNSSLSQSRVLQVHGLHEITCLAELVLATEVEPSFVEKALVRDLARQDLKKVHLQYVCVCVHACACVSVSYLFWHYLIFSS